MIGAYRARLTGKVTHIKYRVDHDDPDHSQEPQAVHRRHGFLVQFRVEYHRRVRIGREAEQYPFPHARFLFPLHYRRRFQIVAQFDPFW